MLGDETLRAIARELVTTVLFNWTVHENMRTQMYVLVKRILRPPDKLERATQTVLVQTEALS